MTKLSAWKTAWAVVLFCTATAIAVQAQVFTTLVSFEETNGASPLHASLVQGADGNLYGTTVHGGMFGGTAFKITPEGTLTSLVNFYGPNGGYPEGGLLLTSDGNFYGTTQGGGTENSGTVFMMTPYASITTLYSFCQQTNCSDGLQPVTGLIQAINGSFHGTTQGAANNYGTIFNITSQGVITTLHGFDWTDGALPSGALAQGTDGIFYGTTYEGGANNDGTIFKITPRGALTTLHSFCAKPNCKDGAYPYAALIQATDGNFYGTTEDGGAYGRGTVFRFTPRGTVTVLHSFDLTDGSGPDAALIQATDGNFYGTTSNGGDLSCNAPNGCGTVFQITPGGTLSTVHSFELYDGAQPTSGLVQATNGTFYGTTYIEGGYGWGTVFSLSTGLGPFVAFVRAAGRVGQTGGILGQGFTGTTRVSLNGIPAKFTVKSDTYLTATVPPGATTGYVTVTTPTGTLTSNVPFHVIP